MQLALVLTANCNASCSHCTTNCGPTRTESLGSDDIIRLMNEAAEIHDSEPLQFKLTGGEPFLDFALLMRVVEHGSKLGAPVSCVTNAYWAHSDEVAKCKLAALQTAGLTQLGVSVSRFHQKFIPLHRARRALKAAADIGLHTMLKGAVTAVDLEKNGLLSKWTQQLEANVVNIFPVLPHLRDGANLPDDEYCREPGLPNQVCPGEIVCIEPDGTACSCCGPGFTTTFLSLGNVFKDSLSLINKRFGISGKQEILRRYGPIEFARGAIAAGFGHHLRGEYAGPCDLCLHIGTNPELRRIAEIMSAKQETFMSTI